MSSKWTTTEDQAIHDALEKELSFTEIRTLVPNKRTDVHIKKRITEIYAKQQGVCPKCGNSKKLDLGKVCCGSAKSVQEPLQKRPKAKKWTPEEDKNLLAQVKERMSIAKIQETTSRNSNAIQFRIAAYVISQRLVLTKEEAQGYKISSFLDDSLFKLSPPPVEPPPEEPPTVKPPNLRKPKPRLWEDSDDSSLLQQLRNGIHKYDVKIEGKNPAEISERIRILERAKAFVRTPRVSTTHSTLKEEKVYPGPNYSLPDIPPVYSVPLPDQLEATIHRANKTCIKCEGDLYSSAHCKTCHEEFDNQWTQEVFDHWKTKNQPEHGILPDRGDDFISHLAGRFQKLPGERFIDAIGGTGHACLAAKSMGYQEIIYNDPDESTSALITQLKGGEKVRKDLFTLVNKIQHRHSFGPNNRDSEETKAAKRYLRIRGSGGVWAGDFTNPNAIQLYEHLEVHSENVYNFLTSILDDKHEKNLFLINLLRLPPGVFSQVAACVRKMDRCILIAPDSISHVQTFNFLPHQYYFTHKGYLVFSRIELSPLAGMLEISQD